MSKFITDSNLNRLVQTLNERFNSKLKYEEDRAIKKENELEDELQAVEDMLGGKSLRYVTQAEYDNLSEEDKNNENVVWAITDAKDLSHTHDNMDILGSITQENIDAWNNSQAVLPDNIVTEDELQAVEDMFGGKSLRYVTQAEYDALTEEDKNNENVMYFITDAEEVDISLYQLMVDDNLNTEDKTVVGAINNLNDKCITSVDFNDSSVFINYTTGIHITSPNGTVFKLIVDDEGNLSTERL